MSRRHIARLTAVLGLASAILVVPVTSQLVPTASAAPCTLCGGGEFHPLTPARIFDSRPATSINDVAPLGAKPLSGPEPATFDIDLLGQGGIPDTATNVLAVVVNITVTEPGANGYLEAYGKSAKPVDRTSIINFAPNQTVPNVSIVRPGADGALTIGLFGNGTTAQVVVDVFGWFSTSTYTAADGARLIPTTPSRVLDTRDGTNRVGATPLGQKETMELQIRGVDGVNPTVVDVVPDSPEVTGVLLNVVGITTDPGATATHLSVFPNALPAGQDPTTSNVNLAAGVIKANLVFVPVGTDGKVRIFNNQGQTQVVADVVGYMRNHAPETTETRQGRVVPLSSPYRTFDTRLPQWGSAPLGPGQAEDWSFADFASSVAIGPDAVGAQLAVIGNLTSASVTRQYPTAIARSFLTAYPADVTRPLSSNLNTVEGPPIPNMAVLKYGASNTMRVYNLAGYAHYLFDASAVVLADA
ncbi:MAG: hypothetical protein JJD93_05845 [Ilumatobacteraceae bacterium]|nr:hypothetical protein [Ilumatobacteraceae bacterium]